MTKKLETIPLSLTAKSAMSGDHILEAAIKYFINQLPMEKRPHEGEEIDVSNFVHAIARLRKAQG